MAIYIDVFGKEYAKDGDKFLNMDTGKHEQVFSLHAIWNRDDKWITTASHWVPRGGTSCSDEERRVDDEIICDTREIAKELAIKELERYYRSLAIYG